MITIYDFIDEDEGININDVVTLAYENEDTAITKKIYDFLAQFYDDEQSDNPTMDDVIDMILGMPEDVADHLYTDIDGIMRGVEEAWSHVFSKSSRVLKKRHFFKSGVSKADLLRNKKKNSALYRLNKAAIRVKRAANANAIRDWDKAWRDAKKKGQHFSAMRTKV